MALTRKKEAAIHALLDGAVSVKAAAEACGVSTRTIFRWLEKDDEFRQALRDRTGARSLAQTAAFSGASKKALQALLDVMADKEAGAGARVSAARVILSAGDTKTDSDVIIGKLEHLEKLYGKKR